MLKKRSWVCHGALFAYFLKNKDMIQMMIISTTRIAITPTATPALNIPVITEQLLKANNASVINDKFNFFIDRFSLRYDIAITMLRI